MSERSAPLSEKISNLILQHYLGPTVRHGDAYEFFHESDLSLNVVRHYANKIYEDNASFVANSINIAKHLHSTLTHPNVLGGELLVLLFDDVRGNHGPEQAIGLFKVESKSAFLDITEYEGVIHVCDKSGISLEKIQKGAVILSKTKMIFAVDATSIKSKYWIDDFLKVSQENSHASCTRAAGEYIRTISGMISSPCDVALFGRELEGKGNCSSIEAIREVAATFVGKEDACKALDTVYAKAGHRIPADIKLDKKKLYRIAKETASRIPISDGVYIYISDASIAVSAVDLKRTQQGLKALIEFTLKTRE